MTVRERIFVGCAVGVLMLFGVFYLVLRPGASASFRSGHRESLGELRQEVGEKARLNRRLRDLERKESVTIPSEDIPAQIQKFIATMESRAGQSGMALTALTPEAISPAQVERKRRAGSKVSFDLKIAGPHRGIVSFVEGLGEDGMPFEVESLEMKANMQQPDALEGTMRLSFCLLEPMDLHAEEKKDEPRT